MHGVETAIYDRLADSPGADAALTAARRTLAEGLATAGKRSLRPPHEFAPSGPAPPSPRR